MYDAWPTEVVFCRGVAILKSCRVVEEFLRRHVVVNIQRGIHLEHIRINAHLTIQCPPSVCVCVCASLRAHLDILPKPQRSRRRRLMPLVQAKRQAGFYCSHHVEVST